MQTQENRQGRLLEDEYFSAKYWQHEIEFFDDEIAFFKKLLDKYFAFFSDKANYPKVQGVIGELLKFEKVNNSLKAEIRQLIDRLDTAMINPEIAVSRELSAAYAVLQQEIEEQVKAFRAFKRSLFALSEQILTKEKGAHLLSSE